MAFTEKASPTRGALVKFRTSLDFVQKAMSVLKLKRDRLAADLNSLLKEMERRDVAEEHLMRIYSDFKSVLAMLGYSEVYSASHSVGRMKVKVSEDHVMNVPVPGVRIEAMPKLDVLGDPSLTQTGKELQSLVGELLEIARIEASIERMAYELSLVNRKINAIEKMVIPNYQTNIKYIENFLSDEELEDFTRIKHVKAISREKKT
jgi:V/A-type H+-transporting ATPase subunit D